MGAGSVHGRVPRNVPGSAQEAYRERAWETGACTGVCTELARELRACTGACTGAGSVHGTVHGAVHGSEHGGMRAWSLHRRHSKHVTAARNDTNRKRNLWEMCKKLIFREIFFFFLLGRGKSKSHFRYGGVKNYRFALYSYSSAHPSHRQTFSWPSNFGAEIRNSADLHLLP